MTGPGAADGGVDVGGLPESEAQRRLSRDGPNALPRSAGPSLLLRILRQVAEPLSLVLVAAALASIVVLGHRVEGLTIAAIVVLNVAIGTAQESRAASAIAALEELTSPTARVRRDGVTRVVPAASLVRGDVVELAAGDRVPADVVLDEAIALAVDEAILTGESFPADKRVAGPAAIGTPPADRPGEAFAGTMVVRGKGVGTILRTGRFTEIGAIASALEAPVEPPLLQDLRVVAARMSVLAVGLGAALVPLLLVRSAGEPDRVGNAVLAGVAMAVAAIPEGLATIVVTALALGARRMADRGAIVRRLAAIEGLGSAQVICTDKTGTITTGQLAVRTAIAAPGREADLWQAGLRCNDGRGDPVDAALLDAADERLVVAEPARRIDERPFSTDTRSMTTVDLVEGSPVLSLKGAPEAVLGRCTAGDTLDDLAQAASTLAEDGMRVLAFATSATDDLDAVGLIPLGVIAFHDPLRESAVEAVARCHRAGIRVVLVTGDHVATARAVAAGVGIHGPAVSGYELAPLEPEARAARLREADVVARVDPRTKLDLVEAHRSTDSVVAMTGDGVNDAPALRRSDIGVAMAGGGGTDVAREAADVVVTNGDLETIVAAVSEGRRIHRNLRSVVGYLLTGNLSEVLVVAASLALLPDLAVPLLPVQLLWVNLVTDGIPALALGVDEPASDPLLEPATTTRERLLGSRRLRTLVIRAAMLAGAVLAAGLLAKRWGWDDQQVRTQLLLALLCAHLMLTYAARARKFTFERGWWRSRVVAAAVGGSLLAQVLVLCTRAGRAALHVSALPPGGWLLAAGATILALAGIDLLRLVSRRRRRT
jgi:calcium-translocating P-type ATPase